MAFKILIGLAFLAGSAQVALASNPVSSPAAQKRYVQRAQAQINYLSTEIHHAERNLSHLNTTDKRDCQDLVRRLWIKERLARVRLETIRKARAEDWLQIRKQEDILLVHIQKSYQHLINQYFK